MRLAVLAGCLALALSAPVQAEETPPAITVMGEASISIVPDLAIIDAGVGSEAKTAREASDAANIAMGKILLALKTASIPDKDVQTQRLSLSPVYAQNRSGGNAITGYRASHRVGVTLRDMTLIASMLDQMLAAGANEIGGVSFSVSEPSKLMDEARKEALADARRKAEIYARAAGVELGAPLLIAEQGGGVPVFAKRMNAALDTARSQVAVGEETLRVGLTASWAIKR